MSSDSPQNRGRTKKRPPSNSGESENTSVEYDEGYYHPLEAAEKQSPRHRSLSKRRKTRDMEEAGDKQDASEVILETLVRMESKTNKVTDQLDKILTEIFEIKKENDELKARVKKLENKREDLETEISRLNKTVKAERELRNSLEQYTRKDNFKIINLPKDSDKETTDETETKVVELIQTKLGIASFSPEHISVAHRVGKFSQGQNRPVIVRLTTRKVKTEIFKQKKTLKTEKIFIYEDLTKINTQRLFNLKNHPGVLSAWSFQGKLYCKLTDLRVVNIDDGDLGRIDRLIAPDCGIIHRQDDRQEGQALRLSGSRGGNNSRGSAVGRGGGAVRGLGRGRPYVNRRGDQGSPSFRVTLSDTSPSASQEVAMLEEITELNADSREDRSEDSASQTQKE